MNRRHCSQRNETTMMVAVCFGWFALGAIQVYESWVGRRLCDVDQVQFPPPRFRVDLQKAPEAELRLLPEIGPQLARRIVEARQNGTRLRSAEDLRAIQGIGAKRVEMLRAYIEPPVETTAEVVWNPPHQPMPVLEDKALFEQSNATQELFP